MASEFFGRQRECRFYTAGCGNKMAVSVTGPHAVNELGGPVIPGNIILSKLITTIRKAASVASGLCQALDSCLVTATELSRQMLYTSL